MNVIHWNWFCHKVLPAVYDESLSYYEVVCKLIDHINGLTADQAHLVDLINGLNTSFEELRAEFTEITSQWGDYKCLMDSAWEEYKNNLNGDWSKFQADLNQEWDEYQTTVNNNFAQLEVYIKGQLTDMQTTLDKIKNGEYEEFYTEAIQNYINNNLQELVARIAKFVTFGVSKEGHFVAYIPEAWDFLEFYTDMTPENSTYGRLQLIY